MFTGQNLVMAEELLEVIWFFNQKGWSPATSTNYSVRTEKNDQLIISRSGVDKSQFKLSDFIFINLDGKIDPKFSHAGIKSSAETEIHTYLYQKFPGINCVLHTHSLLGTVLSQLFVAEKKISFKNWEILKGLDGNTTHDMEEILPVVSNSQNMSDILNDIDPKLTNNTHGFLIAGHGLYTWGKNIPTARRHVETFEFLFECFEKMRK